MDAGLGAERAAFDDAAFVHGDRELVKLLGGKVPVDRREVLEAEFLGAVCAVPQTRLFHANLRRPTRDTGTAKPPLRFHWEAGAIMAPDPLCQDTKPPQPRMLATRLAAVAAH